MKQIAFIGKVIVGLAACVVAGTVRAEESYWYGEINAAGNYVDDPSAQSSFTNSAFWSLTKDVRPIVYDDTFHDLTVDYYILNGKTLRVPRLVTSEWKGKSLHVGSNAQRQTATFAFCSIDPNPTTTTFHNDGLVLERGLVAQFNNSQGIIKGKVQVLSTQSDRMTSTINNN